MFRYLRGLLAGLLAPLLTRQALVLPLPEVSDEEVCAAIRAVPRHFATTGFTTTLTICATGGTLASVGEIISIKFGGGEAKAIDTSHLNSTNRWATFLAGFKRVGDLTFKTNYISADWLALLALVGVVVDWKVTFPDTKFISGSGVLLKFPEFDVPEEDRITTDVTVKVSGAVTTG